jgi:hypothetical protein
MITICCMDERQERWKKWINTRFIEWRGTTRKSVSEFARELNVSQPVISGWLNYGSIPSTKNLRYVAEKYPEVYTVLDLPDPEMDPRTSLLNAGFPPMVVDEILALRDEYSEELDRKGITTDSPEAEQIIRAAFERHGFKYTIKHDDEISGQS